MAPHPSSGHFWNGAPRLRTYEAARTGQRSPKIRHLRTYRLPTVLLTACFQYVACGLYIALPYASLAGMAAMQSIATTTDGLQDREISAAEVHGVYAKWTHGGRTGRGTKGAL